jgi:hypothetical protein
LHAPQDYDLSVWHYKPFWCQPYSIVSVGVGFVVAANLLTEPSLKTTVIASAPILLWWYIFLWVMPEQFKTFAMAQMKEHPECKECEGDQ